ncbi:Arc family DNA-binding protein [Salmonella enterica]|nr:Arc family DNA-binding protein [Salmonella enterica]EDW0096182.1 Arc family DNA-binding protein [Salmonella enterica subsp. enterica serovar Gaminara]EBC0167628.1 Arc family DNA-binding protein [Salmonella enterica]EBR2769200.1 Arc family DNA-binding protein [Salmonella enterica]EHS7369294.1 Arc family DNA-binding protein [Salmonella enterica]
MKNEVRPPQVNIRMPELLRDTIRTLASLNGRSMNSEIVQVLKEYVHKNSEVLTALTARTSDLP